MPLDAHDITTVTGAAPGKTGGRPPRSVIFFSRTGVDDPTCDEVARTTTPAVTIDYAPNVASLTTVQQCGKWFIGGDGYLWEAWNNAR